MAVATAVVTVTGTSIDQNTITAKGTIAVQASPAAYAAGGLTASFAGFDQIKSSSAPLTVRVYSQPAAASPGTTKFVYQFNPGTTLANGKLQAFEQSGVDDAPLDEVDDGASIPAGVSGDTIYFEAVFPRL